jgi:hypothetical protein
MTKNNTAPFTIPAKIESNLAQVQSYWKGLLRGENKVPFWDDVEAQCRAAVEHQSPTYFQASPSSSAGSYSRMVLPLWGQGRVSMLLEAIAR